MEYFYNYSAREMEQILRIDFLSSVLREVIRFIIMENVWR